jgi:RHS repeat-associated protein
MELKMIAPGQSETGVISNILTPGYDLTTTMTSYDSNLGNTTTTISYNDPAYGIIGSITTDPGGLNLQNQVTYENPGIGYLRQTSRTEAGNSVYNYSYYSATETMDNPCTPEGDPVSQAGMAKGKIEPDPDGMGPESGRRVEIIYNASGNVAATRYNNDAWTCTTYDARNRTTETITPVRGNLSGRTITSNYIVGGNPLVTSIGDGYGTITTISDILGKIVAYTDANNNTSNYSYDTYGRLTSKTSVVGTESYEYDQYDRLTVHKLDGVAFATVSYDLFGRVDGVEYQAGISLSDINYDSLGRQNGLSYSLADSSIISDTVIRSTSGIIVNGTENGIGKSYGYDTTGRLVNATIGDNSFTYKFGTEDASCSALTGNNTNAGKSGNRTSQTVNGDTTIYCYDFANRLIGVANNTLDTPQYDDHGNTVSLGTTGQQTEFSYDVSDRNVSIASGDKERNYTRDALDRIKSVEDKENGYVTSLVSYGFTDDSDSPDYLADSAGTVKQKYLTLPGGVSVTIKTDSTSAGATTYSLSNLHGDVSATINADGALMDTFMTGPFGEVLPNQPATKTNATLDTNNPVNTASGSSYGYVGKHQKSTETDISPILGGVVQMGARVYIPAMGRFLSVDPVEGGTDNSYSYANDPVNQSDITGKAIPIIAAAALYLAGVAWATYRYSRNPTYENAFWLVISLIPGVSLIRCASSVLLGGLYAITVAKYVKTALYTAQQAYNCHQTGCAKRIVSSIINSMYSMYYTIVYAPKRGTSGGGGW